MISWIEQGRLPEKTETGGKAREIIVVDSMFDPEVFKMKAANRNQIREV